jgi:outer membrane protein W
MHAVLNMVQCGRNCGDRMKRALSMFVVVLLFSTISVGAADQGDWTSRISGAWSGTTVKSALASGEVAQFDRGIDLAYELDYSFLDDVAANVGIRSLRLPVHGVSPAPDSHTSATDHLNLAILTLGINYQAGHRKTTAFVGPFLALTSRDTLGFRYGASTTPVTVSDSWTWGVQAGIGVRPYPRSPWAVEVSARYTDLRPRLSTGAATRADLTPLAVAIGFSFRL